jgi:hypothetical protein
MSATREQIATAVFSLVSGAYAFGYTSRRLRLWGDDPLATRPSFYMTQGEAQPYNYGSGTIYGSIRRLLKIRLWFYANAKDPTIIGATQLNEIWDAVDAVIFPSGGDAMTGKNTLGGLVDDCRIANVPVFDAGDLDGDGLLMIDLEVTMP